MRASHPLTRPLYVTPPMILKRVGTEMALHVLAYNLKRVINIIGIRPLIAAMRAAEMLFASFWPVYG